MMHICNSTKAAKPHIESRFVVDYVVGSQIRDENRPPNMMVVNWITVNFSVELFYPFSELPRAQEHGLKQLKELYNLAWYGQSRYQKLIQVIQNVIRLHDSGVQVPSRALFELSALSLEVTKKISFEFYR